MTIRARWVPALRVWGGVAGLCLALACAAQRIEWTTDYSAALHRAREENKPLLINFSGSDWCSWCKRLDEEVFSRPEYAAYAASRFVHLVVDTTRQMLQSGRVPHQYLLQRYGVEGFPTIIIADPRTNEPLARGGYMRGGVAAFIKFLAPYAAKATPNTGPNEGAQKVEGLSRGADAVLAMVEQLLAAPPDAAHALERGVLLSRWQSVGEQLAALPEDAAAKRYGAILTVLASKSGAESSAPLAPEEVLKLADLCPGELSDQIIKQLGGLLREALKHDHPIAAVIGLLEAGTRRLGGQAPAPRRLASRLLFAAGQVAAAVQFLDDPETAARSGDPESLRYHIRNLADLGIKHNDRDALLQAWELTQILLKQDTGEDDRKYALAALVEQLPYLPAGTADGWLGECFSNSAALAAIIVQRLGDQVMANPEAPDIARRTRQLATLKAVDRHLQTWSDRRPAVAGAARAALAWAWLAEAEHSITNAKRDRLRQFRSRTGQRNSRDAAPKPYVPVDSVLAAAPDPLPQANWSPGLPTRLEAAKIRLAIQAENIREAADEILDLRVASPQLAGALASELIEDWVTFNAIFEPVARTRGLTGRRGRPIPLTAARHRRVLDELATIARRFRGLAGLPISEHLWVNAFVQCYPRLAVFEKNDIERVFGPIETLDGPLAASFAQTMRMNLTSIWRDPEQRQAAGQSPNRDRIHTEIVAGYQLLRDILAPHLKDKPMAWRIHTFLGAVLFDWAEFEHDAEVKLETYVGRREAAFDELRKGASLYAGEVPSLSPAEYSLTAYQAWFQTVLGASDLAHLSGRGQMPEQRLEAIRDALRSLPGTAAQAHLTLFANQLANATRQLPPDAKPRFLRAALVIAGDQPESQEARELVEFYDQLIGEYGEVKLLTRLDGPAQVGHTQPFGLTLVLRHTEQVAASTGGFNRYLSSGTGMSRSRQRTDYREQLEANIRDALGESFELLSVTFRDAQAEPLITDSPGWLETPLAFVLLRARDPAVDRIPPIQMDLDFEDPFGPVVLPILSPIVPIDARDDTVSARPCESLELIQILDARRWQEGTLTVEVQATAQGIIPPLNALLAIDFPGFGPAEVTDEGQVVKELATSTAGVVPVCERDWVLTLKPEARPPKVFQFAASATPGVTVRYRRYDDADLVDVDSDVALAGIALGPSYTWLGVLLAVTLIAVGLWVLARRLRRDTSRDDSPAHRLPATITPFTVIALLERLAAEPTVTAAPARAEALREDIRRIEQAHFSANGHTPLSVGELRNLADRWLDSLKAER